MGSIVKILALFALVMFGVVSYKDGGLISGGGYLKGNNGIENVSSSVVDKSSNSQQTSLTISSNTSVVTPAIKEFWVIIDKNIILYNNETIKNVQSLIEIIVNELGEGEQALVILHDDTAIENTLEDIKNTLDKNKIPWITPTPIEP
ncbi:MAG: hypothetical protein ACI4FZ_02955 [Lachnospiraceae bacterium]